MEVAKDRQKNTNSGSTTILPVAGFNYTIVDKLLPSEP